MWNIGMSRSRSFSSRSCVECYGMARSVLASSPSSTSFLEGRIPAVGSQHKRGLLWAVNVAVDKIVSHFSVARNIVQKAQLGDSRINPSVGRLVLCDLCPALYTILSDGLNPYKQDLIMGRRPNTPWSVVEASVKTVPCMKPLYNLYYQLDQISHINSAQKKFNAFIFSLLNLKRLEFWISCLQGCGELLTTHYSPTAFLSLSHTTCSVLFEEFLLLLQPLSVLTFHLDPLFEYHHQPLAERGALGSHPQPRGQVRKEGQPGQPGEPPQSAGEDSGSAVEQDSSQRKEVVRVGGTAEGAWGQRTARRHQGGQGESSYTLHRTFDQVMQWGDRLAQSLGELAKGPTSPWATPRPTPLETPSVETAPAGDRRTQGWWNQLSQSSQVYLSSTSGSGRWVKPKARGGKGSSLMDLTKCQSLVPEEGGRAGQLCHEHVANSNSTVQDPDQRGSVTDCTPPIDLTLQEEPTQTNPPNGQHSPDKQQDPTPGVQIPSEKPEEGMPVTESRLECQRSELDGTMSPPARDPLRRGSGSEREGTVRRDSLWLGRLFGARIPSTYSPSEQRPRNSQEPHRGRRLPSEWLSLDRKGLQWLQTVIPRPKERPAAPTQINPPSEETPKPARMVRTLCDHTATADDQLSFGKGAVLEILSCVDEDWIRCRDGDVSGLVPIGYTSLI